MLHTALFTLVTLLAAAVPQQGQERGDIRVLLQEIADSVPRSPYQGDAIVRRLSKRLERIADEPPSAESAQLLRELGNAELRIGREREAIEHLEAALAQWPADWATGSEADSAIGSPMDERVRLARETAVAWLRLAETENCCQRNTAESCIVPLRAGALHDVKAGATNAIEHLVSMLAIAPAAHRERPLGQWLLNLAYMALDRYPDGVPSEHRIDPAHFSSEIEFPRFANIAGELGVDNFSLAGGVVVDDLDLDGDFDLLTSTNDLAGELRLYLREDDGRLRECHAAAGLSGLYGGLNMIHADYDGDGDPDVLVLRGGWLRGNGRHPNSLLRNDGLRGDGESGEESQLTFTDVTFAEGLGQPHYPTQAAGFADYDNDGDLDLYIGNESLGKGAAPSQLFRNDGPPGDGRTTRFVDVAKLAGVENLRFAKAVSWGDYDADGDPDLFVSNFTEENRLYRNAGDGTFQDVAPELGLTWPLQSFPAWFFDYDNDGALDLFVSNYCTAQYMVRYYVGAEAVPGTHPRLLRNRGDGSFVDVGPAAGLDRPVSAMGCNFGDLDGDGWLDFYLGTGWPAIESIVPNVMFLNRGGERFVDVTMAGGFGHLQKGHGIAFVDIDGDGDQDVFEQMGGAFGGDRYRDALFENPGFGNRWLSLKLVGQQSNRSAIGARIAVTVIGADDGRRTIRREVNTGASFGSSPLEQYVGLGSAQRIEHIEVFWPTSGLRQRFEQVPLDRRLVITEGQAQPVVRSAR